MNPSISPMGNGCKLCAGCTSKECSGCEKKYFCSYCIIRGLVAAKEKGFENCAWYSQYIPNEFRRLLI